MAYASDESGAFQVYVRAFPDTDGKWQISTSGGAYPMWSRTGHEIFFETLESRIMVFPYAVNGDSFMADKPRVWSETPIGGSPNVVKNVDLAPDGKRVVALMPVETAEGQKAQRQVTVREGTGRRDRRCRRLSSKTSSTNCAVRSQQASSRICQITWRCYGRDKSASV
jgi:hypothetical protein